MTFGTEVRDGCFSRENAEIPERAADTVESVAISRNPLPVSSLKLAGLYRGHARDERVTWYS